MEVQVAQSLSISGPGLERIHSVVPRVRRTPERQNMKRELERQKKYLATRELFKLCMVLQRYVSADIVLTDTSIF